MMRIGKEHPFLLKRICQASRTTILDRYLQGLDSDELCSDEFASDGGRQGEQKRLRQFLFGQLSENQREYCMHRLDCASPDEMNLRVECHPEDGLALANSRITHSCATLPRTSAQSPLRQAETVLTATTTSVAKQRHVCCHGLRFLLLEI